MIAQLQVLGSTARGQILNNDLLIESFRELTIAQAASVAATSGLDYATLEATLSAAGFNLAQRNEIAMLLLDAKAKQKNTAATIGQSAATTGATAATGGFSAALRGLWTVMKQHPFMAILSVLTILSPLIIKIADEVVTTSKELAEQFDELRDKCNNLASEISTLESELETTQSRIQELQDLSKKGSLTPDQTAELATLKETNAELVRELEIKERLAEIARSEAENTAYEAIVSTKYESLTDPATWTQDATGTEYFVKPEYTGVEMMYDLMDAMEQVDKKRQELDPNVLGLDYETQLAELNAEYTKYETRLGEVITEQQKWADAIDDTEGPLYEAKKAIEDAVDAWLLFDVTPTDTLSYVRDKATADMQAIAEQVVAIRHLINEGFYDETEIVNAENRVETLANSFRNSFGEFVDDAIRVGYISGNTTQDILKLIDALASVPEYSFAGGFVQDLTSHLGNMKTLEENIGSLQDALAEFRDDGIVSMSTIVELDEKFGTLSGFEEFVNTVGDSTSTWAEVQGAFNRLAEAYLNSDDILKNLTVDTADATIAELEHLGVLNAKEIVMQRLRVLQYEAQLSAAGLVDAEWEYADASDESTSATRRSVKSFLEEIGAAQDDIEALRLLRIQKIENRLASIDFTNANAPLIASLISQAKAAGLATDSMEALMQLQRIKDAGGMIGEEQIAWYAKVQQLQEQVKADIDEFVTDLRADANVIPTSNSGKTALEKEIEETKKLFQTEYDAWQHKVDMQEKTIQEFYAWLDGADGYKKYFTNEKDFLEEIQKYEKEVFDGRKEILESYLQDCDHSISILERQAERQIRNAEKVVESQETAAQRLASLRSEMEENFGEGNVDLTARVRVENDDGSYSTVASEWLSQEIADQEVAIHYTPILDGKFLDDDVLDSYIKELYSGAESAMEILERDKVENGGLGLVLRVKADFDFSEEQAWGEELHLIQEEYYDLQNAISSGTIDPNQKMIATAPDRLAVQNEIIALYRQEQTEIHKAIDELERYLKSVGLSDDEIARNDLMQEYVQMLYEAEDAIIEIQDAVHEEITGNLNDLIDLTEEMIRQEKEDQIDALEKQKDAYREIIDLQKKMLESSKKESDYKDSIAEKTKRLAEIENDLAALGRDTSREARLEEGALLEEQAKLQKELADLQRDHHLDAAQEALDKEYDEFEKTQDAKIDKINDFLDNNLAVNKAAIAELDTMNEELYDRLTEYALHYTDTTKAELLDMWETASAAAEKYGSITNASQVYEENDVDNEVQSILRQMRANGAAYGSASKEEKAALAADSERLGEELEAILKVDVHRDNNGVWWIGDEKLFDVFTYHTGTASVGGNATLKQNEVFAKLEEGESVLTSGHQTFLHKVFNFDFASAMKSITDPIAQMFKSAQRSVPVNDNRATTIHVEAPIHITGDLTNETMRIIKQHPREISDVVSKQLRML